MTQKDATKATIFAMAFFTLVTMAWADAPANAQTNADPANAGAETAQPEAEKPTELTISIVEVDGMASYRTPDAEKATRCKADTVVPMGSTFITGPSSSVIIAVGTDQIFRIDRMTEATVVRAEEGTEIIKTDLALKHGRIRFDVDSHDKPKQYDTKIHTPRATLAVRGTTGAISDEGLSNVEVLSFAGNQKNAIGVTNNQNSKLVNLGKESSWDGQSGSAPQSRKEKITTLPGPVFGPDQLDKKQAYASGGVGTKYLDTDKKKPTPQIKFRQDRIQYIKSPLEFNDNDRNYLVNGQAPPVMTGGGGNNDPDLPSDESTQPGDDCIYFEGGCIPVEDLIKYLRDGQT